MAGNPGASPALTPVGTRGGPRSGWISLGLILVALVTLVGISVIEPSSARQRGIEATPGEAKAEARVVPVVTASSTATSVATPPRASALTSQLGTPPPRVGVAPGTVRACPAWSGADTPGPVDQARPPMTYVAPMVFDRRAGRLVLLADSQTWTFDVCTNTWSRMHPSLEPPGPSTLVYDVDAGVTIAFDGENGWAYDLAADVWTRKSAAPLDLQGQRFTRGVYDAGSGLVVLLAPAALEPTARPERLWTYEVETDTWRAVDQVDAPAGGLAGADRAVVAYDSAVDRLIAYAPVAAVTRLFDFRTGTWSQSSAATPKLQFGWSVTGGEIAYDESIERTIAFGFGRVIAYDSVADSWEVLVAGNDPDRPGDFTGPTSRQTSWMVYDPVNERLVVYGGEYRRSTPVGDSGAGAWVQADDVLAFDPATRQWTVLLAASKVQPPS